jgi:hypothetical protein
MQSIAVAMATIINNDNYLLTGYHVYVLTN